MAVISFSRRLRELAEAQPDRPAITCGDDTVTRAELVQRGDDLAVYLHQHGVRQGDMVTIAVPNSIDWFVAYVAAWRLGATRSSILPRLKAAPTRSRSAGSRPRSSSGVSFGFEI